MYINEMFSSIQGEGSFTGTPAHFIRFQGCPIQCPWCDSKNSWNRASYLDFPLAAIIATFAELRDKHQAVRHVVLTGGEPFWDNPELLPLIKHLCTTDLSIQIETSGTQSASRALIEFMRYEEVYLTISPKAPLATAQEFLPVDANLLKEAWEIKFPVAGEIDIKQRIPNFLMSNVGILEDSPPMIFLQPVMKHGETKPDPSLVKLVVDDAIKANWRVSVQTHKVLDIR